MTPRSFIVVGAGLGGLATALRLAHLGHRVTVLEKTGEVGGRNKRVRVGESEFDGGPSLVMMLEPFRRLFKDVGESLEDHLELSLCDPSYRVFYRDGTRIDGTPNIARMVEQIEQISGREDAERYGKMLGDLAELYRESIPAFVRKNYLRISDFASPKQLSIVARHRMLGNLAKRIEGYMADSRLRMLFSFQTMYLGLSPYDAPWVYATLTYMEYGEGIWYPRGGVPVISDVIAALAQKRGAEIRLNAPVQSIDKNSVRLESGEVLSADIIICNADLPYAERHLVTPVVTKSDTRRYSCSTLMIYIDYRGTIPSLLHHNVIFGQDFEGNLRQIFHENALPDDPAFYACISSKTDSSRAAAGHENLFLLVPCANLDRPFTDEDRTVLTDRVFKRLACETEFDPVNIAAMKTYSPIDWNRDLNLEKGAAFGLSHEFRQSAFFRPANRSRTNRDLYYVGASTAPGNGMPMVLISAELIEDRLRREGRID